MEKKVTFEMINEANRFNWWIQKFAPMRFQKKLLVNAVYDSLLLYQTAQPPTPAC